MGWGQPPDTTGKATNQGAELTARYITFSGLRRRAQSTGHIQGYTQQKGGSEWHAFITDGSPVLPPVQNQLGTSAGPLFDQGSCTKYMREVACPYKTLLYGFKRRGYPSFGGIAELNVSVALSCLFVVRTPSLVVGLLLRRSL
jgi:hypothetical protein